MIDCGATTGRASLAGQRATPGRWTRAIPTLLLAWVGSVAPAAATVLGFEQLADGEMVVAQTPGLTFSNATAIAAGLSLNEFEFPPRSGSVVVFDDGGPLTIAFATAVASVFGYFTYGAPLTLTFLAADATEMIAAVTSAFEANLALSGDPGSLPNERLGAVSAGGIRGLTIAGELTGGSFTLDDLTFESRAGNTVPEPSPLLLALAAAVAGLWRRSRRPER